MKEKFKKVIILGSGSLKIGEAGEFDYSGSQALKGLKEEHIKTVLVNPNIATIQTSEGMADKIYFLPVSAYFVEKVIKKERPDGIMLSFGGQTALNCGVELARKSVFKRYKVRVLGTSVKAIMETEDRGLFVKRLKEINLKVPKSVAVKNIKEAIGAGEKIGYPVMARVAYALGGRGSGVCYDKSELKEVAEKAFTYTKQILIEEYLKDWKEIEYEVVRDSYDNCVTVCNMENFDPLGIHTGESIVVAPSQTLNNKEYHKLREISIKVIRHFGIIGECNIQFALNPKNSDYRIIEVNARLSRSSALASKATGYPLAFIAAKLALGYSLIELQNSITKKTMACFEPALDYVVVKIPRWDLKKFRRVSKRIGSEMKSVGEVMAIGRKFEEALQKAVRMLQVGLYGVVCNKNMYFEDLERELKEPSDERIFAVAEAIKADYDIDKIYELSGIDKWFLYKIRNIVEIEKELRKFKSLKEVSRELLRKAKENGFSDKQIGVLFNREELEVRKLRKNLGIVPVVKQIDTLAGEYPAETNYLYLTYNGLEDDVDFLEKNRIIVLGSGSYSIGSSVEFDWCCVNAVLTLKKLGYNTIMINYNPETVSTDYDICDRLYFDELSFERVLDIYEKEKPIGIVIGVGGQIPNNIALKCHKAGVRIIGSSANSIDNAEDRHKFSRLLDRLGIEQPEWKEVSSIKDAKEFAKVVKYPVLIRPSYVLSGAAMSVAFSDRDMESYLKKAASISEEHPVVVSKFILNAKEVEIDAVADKGDIKTWAISEHVENAGVHSGDATIVLPPKRTYSETIRKIMIYSKRIAKTLEITGPFNIQFLAKDNDVSVIECNLRASRSFPFVSKVMKVNFIDVAIRLMMGEKVKEINESSLYLDYVGVKVPQFSFSRLKGADPILGVEMASTGEVGCFGRDIYEAFLKSMFSTNINLPKSNVFVSIGGEKNKFKFLDSIKKLKEMKFNIYATEHTSEFFRERGVDSKILHKVYESRGENVVDYIIKRKIDFVINVLESCEERVLDDEYVIRRTAVDFGIPLLTNLQSARLFIDSIERKNLEDLEIKSWDEYK